MAMMVQLAGGHELDIFLDKDKAKKYLCAICQSVFKQATSIGCAEDHIFCKQCLEYYFQKDDNTKKCPSCREDGLNKTKLRSSKFTDRMINYMKVKCILQHQKIEENIDEDRLPNCEWSGDLGDLAIHTTEKCQLFAMICKHCGRETRRFEMEEHDRVCPEKELQCELNCNKTIMRQSMKTHIEHECAMKELMCDECKENILRKDMMTHTLKLCPERISVCPFAVYGCDEKVKHKELSLHLEKEELNHLKLQVKSMQRQLSKVRNGTSNKILLLLKSENVFICDINSKIKEQAKIESFMNQQYHRCCIGKNISFNDAKNDVGFDCKDVNVFDNDIVFGISKNRVNALCIKTKKCKSFSGNISRESYASLYSNDYGLLLIGGNSIGNEEVANHNVVNIKFDNDKFTEEILTALPYSSINPTVITVYAGNHNNDGTLLVCGGWWNQKNLPLCYVYTFGNKQWEKLKNMNHNHQCGGICEWQERGNKIVVAAGYDDAKCNKFVEEYDIHKNNWIDLPDLNEKHETYPALLTSENILFCVGGVVSVDDNLGHIELYDPRDRANKWIHVDTVENYFNFDSYKASTFNCYLPL